MDIDVSREDQVLVVRPSGSIDTRSSFEFEERLNEVLQESPRQLVVDCRDIEQLTSAGIRVLLLAAKRIRGEGGTLSLASPNEHVRTVLEISGLADTFPVVESAAEAVGQMAAEEERPPSKISVVVFDLFSDSEGSREPGAEKPSGEGTSQLSRHVADVLGGTAGEPGDADTDAQEG